jgi:hypothetical protein
MDGCAFQRQFSGLYNFDFAIQPKRTQHQTKEYAVMAQGNAFSEAQIRRILDFLSGTEMTLAEIAQRMGCSRGAIASINRRFAIRDYAGLRSKWNVRTDSAEQLKKQVNFRSRRMFAERAPFRPQGSTDESTGQRVSVPDFERTTAR